MRFTALIDFFTNLPLQAEMAYYRFNDFRERLVRNQFSRAMLCLLAAASLGGATSLFMYGLGYTLAKVFIAASAVAIATGLGAIYRYTRYLHPRFKYAMPYRISKVTPDEATLANHRLYIDALLNSKDKSIKEIKNQLKSLFFLRHHFTLSYEELRQMEKKADTQFQALHRRIKSSEDWERPEIKQELKMMAIEQTIFTHALLSRVEADIREAKEQITPENISRRIVAQGMTIGRYWKDEPKDLKLYHFSFMGKGIIRLYHIARAKSWVDDQGRLIDAHDWPKRTATAFEEDSALNDCRKIYNVFVKHGLYARYGNEQFKAQLEKDDSRFEKFTRRDSKKLLGVDQDEGGFVPRPY
jgi:hypothetical protein